MKSSSDNTCPILTLMKNCFLNTGKHWKVFYKTEFFQVYSATLEQKTNLVRWKRYKEKRVKCGVANIQERSQKKAGYST